MRRIDWAYGVAGRVGQRDAADARRDQSRPACCVPTRCTAMQRAGSRRDALTLLLASPEFQRR